MSRWARHARKARLFNSSDLGIYVAEKNDVAPGAPAPSRQIRASWDRRESLLKRDVLIAEKIAVVNACCGRAPLRDESLDN